MVVAGSSAPTMDIGLVSGGENGEEEEDECE